MKKIMSVVLIFLLISVAKGQTISGLVTDENQNVVPYVNIGVVGLDRGTISDSDGVYQIDITGIDSNQILRFSHVGYESSGFKIDELIVKENVAFNVVLKEQTILLQELEVKAKPAQLIFIGSKKRGRFSWIWDKAINGFEIGTFFRNDKPVVVEKFYFHTKRNYCDSIYYRLKIYDTHEEIPNKVINTRDIKFIAKLKKGWESVDLSNYNITINSDFIVTLEVLESWSSGKYRTNHLSLSGTPGPTFYKPSSMAPWAELYNRMSFRIEASSFTSQE